MQHLLSSGAGVGVEAGVVVTAVTCVDVEALAAVDVTSGLGSPSPPTVSGTSASGPGAIATVSIALKNFMGSRDLWLGPPGQ